MGSATTGTKPSLWQRFVALLAGAHRRMAAQPVIVVFLVTFVVVAWLNPAKIGLALWGVSKLTLFAWTGDWVDRRLFKTEQPEILDGIAQGAAWKRKTWIVCAAIVASALLP